MGHVALVPILHLEHHLGQLLQERPVGAGRELDDSASGRIQHLAPHGATNGSGSPRRLDVPVRCFPLRLLRLPLGLLLEPQEPQPAALRAQHSELPRHGARLGRVIRLIVRHVDGVHEHGLQRVQHVLPKTTRRAAAGSRGGGRRRRRARRRAARRRLGPPRVVPRRKRSTLLVQSVSHI